MSLSVEAGVSERLVKLLATVNQGPESHVQALSAMDFVVFEGKQVIQEYALVEHFPPAR